MSNSEITRKTIFIADLHLDSRYPNALAAFQRYFEQLASQPIDAVYILGDLFEYWLGDDCVDKTAKLVANTLSEYHHKTQVPLFFIHGNRDFLLGQDFAAQCQMKLLPEIVEINLYGIKTLLLHGDTLCTDDEAYQNFRQKVRTTQWQKKILALPNWVRRLKAKHMRYQSKKANAHKNTAIMDVSQSTVDSVMQQSGVTQMIHGHTHRPNIHCWQNQQNEYKRYVVGDWYSQASILEFTEKGGELLTQPLTT